MNESYNNTDNVPGADTLNASKVIVKVPLDEYTKELAKEAGREAAREILVEYMKDRELTCPIAPKLRSLALKFWILVGVLAGTGLINAMSILKVI